MTTLVNNDVFTRRWLNGQQKAPWKWKQHRDHEKSKYYLCVYNDYYFSYYPTHCYKTIQRELGRNPPSDKIIQTWQLSGTGTHWHCAHKVFNFDGGNTNNRVKCSLYRVLSNTIIFVFGAHKHLMKLLMEIGWNCPKANVWSALMERDIGLLFFSKNTVTAATYLEMVENYAVPQLDGLQFHILSARWRSSELGSGEEGNLEFTITWASGLAKIV